MDESNENRTGEQSFPIRVPDKDIPHVSINDLALAVRVHIPEHKTTVDIPVTQQGLGAKLYTTAMRMHELMDAAIQKVYIEAKKKNTPPSTKRLNSLLASFGRLQKIMKESWDIMEGRGDGEGPRAAMIGPAFKAITGLNEFVSGDDESVDKMLERLSVIDVDDITRFAEDTMEVSKKEWKDSEPDDD